ncbi:MAG: hypothetical protein GWN30_08485, partial [Gammaproteobacteria bacterium]|nr:hypothetical protein [Gammaproteobacteria bacterium]
SGNSIDGIRLYGAATTENVIAGNLIGIDITGMASLYNGDNGISIQNGSFENRIGGDTGEERNIISGNDINGIYINDSDNNEIVGNFIGLDASGMTAVPNAEKGIYIVNSNDNTIGYESSYEPSNFISGNQYGVVITGDIPDPGDPPGTIYDVSMGNWIRYNAIGFNYGGEPAGNTNEGVLISVNSQQNKVGPNNWISYNGTHGVRIDTPLSYYNRIYENYIFENDGKGISLTNG